MRWHCKIGDVRRGPLSTLELKWLAADGELRPTDLVKRDGDTAWTRAARVRGLFPSSDPASADDGVAETQPEESLAAVMSVSRRSAPGSVPEGEAAASGSHAAGPKFKLSPRDAVGLAALGLSAVLLVGAIWFAFSRSSSELALDSVYPVSEAPASTTMLGDRSNPAVARSEPPPPAVTQNIDDTGLDEGDSGSGGVEPEIHQPEKIATFPELAEVPKAQVDHQQDHQPAHSAWETP
jgi:hypothetical protein